MQVPQNTGPQPSIVGVWQSLKQIAHEFLMCVDRRWYGSSQTWAHNCPGVMF